MGQPSQDADGTAVRRDETEDNLKKCGLSPTVRSEDCKKVPLKNPEIDSFQNHFAVSG
jgi:hypothetical protein